MAIDISALRSFDLVFVFLLVFIVIYALLAKIKFMGDNRGVHAFIAFLMGLFAIFSPIAVKTLLTAAPWFVLFLFLVVFMLIAGAGVLCRFLLDLRRGHYSTAS